MPVRRPLPAQLELFAVPGVRESPECGGRGVGGFTVPARDTYIASSNRDCATLDGNVWVVRTPKREAGAAETPPKRVDEIRVGMLLECSGRLHGCVSRRSVVANGGDFLSGASPPPAPGPTRALGGARA